jgi:hypothetical protein
MLRISHPAHFEDPRDRVTVAEGDGGRFSNDEKVQQVVEAGKFGWLSWNWIGRSRLSKTAHQNETAQAKDVSPGRANNLHMD